MPVDSTENEQFAQTIDQIIDDINVLVQDSSLDVNILAQDSTLDINIASQSGDIDVNVSNTSLDVYVLDSTMDVNILDSSVDVNILSSSQLDVNIAATQDVSLNVSASEVSVDINSQSLPEILNFTKYGQAYAGTTTYDLGDGSSNYPVNTSGRGTIVSVIIDTGLNEEYHKNEAAADAWLGMDTAYTQLGGAVTPPEDIYVTALEFYISQSLFTDSGTIYYRIRDSNTHEILGEVSFSVGVVNSGGSGYYKYSFPSPVPLKRDKKYYALIEVSGMDAGDEIEIPARDLWDTDSWGWFVGVAPGSSTYDENQGRELTKYKIYYIGGKTQSHNIEPIIELDGNNIVYPYTLNAMYYSGMNEATQPFSLTAFESNGYVCFGFSPTSPQTFESTIKIGVTNNTGYSQKGNISYVYTMV